MRTQANEHVKPGQLVGAGSEKWGNRLREGALGRRMGVVTQAKERSSRHREWPRVRMKDRVAQDFPVWALEVLHSRKPLFQEIWDGWLS